ncbi:MAG: TIGR00266 family protein [Pseudomonadota bacterium]
MVHEIEYRIVGDDMQAVVIILDQNETVRAEAGAMMYMDQGIEMETSTGGGLWKGLKRKLSGESFFITTYTCRVKRAEVAFAAPYPGHITPLDLAQTGPVLCQRDSYLCSAHGIDVTVAFTRRLGAGFFGGEGFVLQRLEGDAGLAFIHAGGTVIERTLAPGQTLKVDTGCLVGFQESVEYDVALAAGVKTMLFGGEGLFLATLTGPGKIWLQTLPFSRLANRIYAAAGGGREETKKGFSLGGLISGDNE